MAEIKNTVKLDFTSTLTLNETEMRALDAIIGYGFDGFIKCFKQHMGEAYIRGHEEGAKELFKAIGRDVGPALRKIDDIRKILNEDAKRRVEADASKAGA